MIFGGWHETHKDKNSKIRNSVWPFSVVGNKIFCANKMIHVRVRKLRFFALEGQTKARSKQLVGRKKYWNDNKNMNMLFDLDGRK